MSDNPAPLGRLKNGNPRGNPANSPRCGGGEDADRLDMPRQPAMKNGRCRLHGGKSPGAPRDELSGNYRHGLRTIEAAAQRRQAAAIRRVLRRLPGVNLRLGYDRAGVAHFGEPVILRLFPRIGRIARLERRLRATAMRGRRRAGRSDG